MSNTVSSSNRFPELEKFELIEEIGHGGMATVYRARDLRLGREVAVKVIHKHLRENPEVRRRFTSEARAVAKLRHRGIVEVYDVSDDEELERYLVVELIRGQSLRQVLQRYEVLPAEVAACIVSLLCDAVEHAHESHVVHRDIKPENVLLELPNADEEAPSTDRDEPPQEDDDGDGVPEGHSGSRPRSSRERSSSGRSPVVVKLTDFGIAKVLDAQGVTSTGQILGSPAHMAPEQIEGGDVGPHTDVFALGVLMYEAMVGHLPFEGKNPAQVLRRVLEGVFEPADSERAAVGGRWARIVARALDVDIDQRVGTAREFGELIDAELAALGVDDPHAELADYFLDPDGYHQRQRDELVGRLLDRGEKERKAGHIQGAASDFNRALALRPDDLAILKRVSSLSAQTLWRDRAKMLSMIGALAAVLFGATFGITRLLKDGESLAETRIGPTPDIETSAPTPSADPSDTPSAEVPDPTPEVSATSSAKAQPDPAPKVTPGPAPATSGSAEAAGAPRQVTFSVIPGGAQLEVDGVQRKHSLGQKFDLTLGRHQYRAYMANADSCCKEVAGSLEVKEGDGVQPFTLRLPLNPATVSLTGAPAGAGATCSNGMSVNAGSSRDVTMNELELSLSCTLTPGGRGVSVKLRAGQGTAIPWR